MLGFLVVLYLCVQKYNNENCSANSDIIENINLDKLYSSDFAETNNISFDYYPTQEIIDEYQKEQTFGTNTVIKYSNKYADKVDINGNINYNTLQYESGNIDDFNVDSRLIYNDEFYKSNVNYIDGKLDPNDTDNIGKTIKEVYDNSFIDFKKLIPKKTMIDNQPKSGASGLSFLEDDDWSYKDEKPENGGAILDSFYASDNKYDVPAIF
jgi:hypothetical protein